jgi:SAM-dependent methyltransferase
MDLQQITWDEDNSGKHSLVPGSFDAVFSNAAIHWCSKSPPAVVQNAWRALKPGGRFAAEMGGFMNLVGTCRQRRERDCGRANVKFTFF